MVSWIIVQRARLTLWFVALRFSSIAHTYILGMMPGYMVTRQNLRIAAGTRGINFSVIILPQGKARRSFLLFLEIHPTRPPPKKQRKSAITQKIITPLKRNTTKSTTKPVRLLLSSASPDLEPAGTSFVHILHTPVGAFAEPPFVHASSSRCKGAKKAACSCTSIRPRSFPFLHLSLLFLSFLQSSF